MTTNDRDIPLLLARDLLAANPGAQPERDPALTRVRHGVYAWASDLEGATREAVYRARVRAVGAVRARPVFARESALALHRIPYGLDPDVVYTTGSAVVAPRKAGVVHARRALEAIDVEMVDGMLVCALPYALAEVARCADPLVAIAALDHALHAELVTKEAVLAALDRQPRRGRAAAEWSIAFADGAAESVGESYSRVRICQLGFAPPDLQVWVEGRSGRLWRVDMRWLIDGRRPLYGEFDGMVKYGALAQRSGQTGAQALSREKDREDDIRFSGDTMHWTWDAMISPRRFEQILLKHRVPRLRGTAIAVA